MTRRQPEEETVWQGRMSLADRERLLEVASEHDLDPSSSPGLEEYFCRAIEDWSKGGDEFRPWLRTRIARDFHSVGASPVWRQDPEWQVVQNRPMVFVGQLETLPAPGILNEAASWYTFYDQQSGEVRTVWQVSCPLLMEAVDAPPPEEALFPCSSHTH